MDHPRRENFRAHLLCVFALLRKRGVRVASLRDNAANIAHMIDTWRERESALQVRDHSQLMSEQTFSRREREVLEIFKKRRFSCGLFVAKEVVVKNLKY